MQKKVNSPFLCVVSGLVILTWGMGVRAQDTGTAPPAAEPEAAESPPADAAPATEAAASTGADEAFLSQPAPAEVAADPAAAPAAQEEPAPESERLKDHHRQGFVNVSFGTGWYFVAPYDKDDPNKRCADWEDPNAEDLTAPAICTGRSAWHLDFLGGYGIRPGFELFAIFRLGITAPSEFASNPRLIGVGLKVYTPNDGLFKIGFGVAPMFDFSTRYGDLGNDFLIHVPILAHFDILPWLGAYLQVAPNISFITEFKLDITAGIGVQGRFP